MNIRIMKSAHLLFCGVLLCVAGNLHAQDPRERNYYYEILQPSHEPKPVVNGFATNKIKENLNRGLTAVPAANGKGVYLSWRLLEQDGNDVSFHLYRNLNGKIQRLTKKPLTATCDFTDKTFVAGKAQYWISVLDKKEK